MWVGYYCDELGSGVSCFERYKEGNGVEAPYEISWGDTQPSYGEWNSPSECCRYFPNTILCP